MLKEQVQNAAKQINEFLRYNQFLREKHHVMVTYELSDDSIPDDENVVSIGKESSTKLKLIPLEDSDGIINQYFNEEYVPSVKKSFDAMKAIVRRCKEDKTYMDVMKRAELLSMIYDQVEVLIVMYYGHVIAPLLHLEDDLYAQAPVDRNQFVIKLANTINSYAEPKEPWSITKERTYYLLETMSKVRDAFKCQNLSDLKEKILSSTWKDNQGYAMEELQKELDESITVEDLKNMIACDEFTRAVELNRFYSILIKLAEKRNSEKIFEALDAENKIYTMPSTWLHRFMINLQDTLLQEEGTNT